MDRGAIATEGKGRHDQIAERNRWSQRPGSAHQEDGLHAARDQLLDGTGQRRRTHGGNEGDDFHSPERASLYEVGCSVRVVMRRKPLGIYQRTQFLQPLHDRFRKGHHSNAGKVQSLVVQTTAPGSRKRLLGSDEKGIGSRRRLQHSIPPYFILHDGRIY